MRYGVQVNSLGLTEAQPENNIIRIVLEALAVTIGPRRPRPRAAAAGLERGAGPAAAVGPAVVAADPADPGLRDRPARLPRHLRGLARDGRAWSTSCSKARAPRWPWSPSTAARSTAVPYMKTQLVESHRARVGRIERGEQKVIGQNVYTEHEPSPLQEGEDGGIMTVDPAVEQGQIDAVQAWRAERDQAAVDAALDELRAAAASRRREHHARHAGRRARPARRPASGPARCARSSASTARRPASATPPRRPRTRR